MSAVKLYVYDLSRGLAAAYAPAFGLDIDGVWHSGVIVHGREIYFGSNGGISIINGVGITQFGAPDRIVDLGTTEVDWDLVKEYLDEMSTRYGAHHYDLLQHNCNHFSQELAQFLTGNSIPEYITSTAKKISATPLGQMLASQVDMGVSPI